MILNTVSGARRSLEGQTIITNSACKCDPTEMSAKLFGLLMMHCVSNCELENIICWKCASTIRHNLTQVPCLSEGEVHTKDTREKHY